MSVCEGEGLGCRSRLCVRQAPLSKDYQSGPDSRRIRYANGRVRGRDRQRFRACEGSRQGATATQPPPFQGCVGEPPSRCTTGVGERCCSDWVWRERDGMPTSSTEACNSVRGRGRMLRTSGDDQSSAQEARPIAEKVAGWGVRRPLISTTPVSDAGRYHSHGPYPGATGPFGHGIPHFFVHGHPVPRHAQGIR